MAAALEPGEQHLNLIDWAKKHGVAINGVAPAKFVGSGMGIVAARDLKAGEQLVHVRHTSLISAASPSVRSLNLPLGASIHGSLAAFLTLSYEDKTSAHRAWQEVWPSQEELKNILPFYWPKEAQDLLPEAAKALLSIQQSKIEADWQTLRPHLGASPKSLFIYAWLIVSTRTFFWDYPDIPGQLSPRLPKKRAKLTADDCYAMCPFMDYFNHQDHGCKADYDAKGYSVTADRDYKAGDEVYFSYGPHSNCFLLLEYGFILSNNSCDSVSLDHLVLPALSAAQAEILKDDRFHGSYTLSSTPPYTCHRTQAALRLLILPTRRYTAFISGTDDGGAEQSKIDSHLLHLLTNYSRTIVSTMEEAEALETETKAIETAEVGKGKRKSKAATEREANGGRVSAEQKEILLLRWKQIRQMVNDGVRALGG